VSQAGKTASRGNGGAGPNVQGKGGTGPMTGSMRAAVLLDQHPLWLEAVEHVLDRVGVNIAASTTQPEVGLELIERHRPDVFVVDIQTPGDRMSGLDCLRDACARVPSVRAIVLSASEDSADVDAAFAAGAVAYVVKTAHPEDLASAVRQAFEHSVYLAGAPNASVPAQHADYNVAERESAGLTKRELEILKLVSQGHSNAALAKMLWVTEQTVKFHLSNIYRKLDVSNRTEASRWAQVHGLLGADALEHAVA
jgi:two-component system nitrate/nitrite response regulator NarL